MNCVRTVRRDGIAYECVLPLLHPGEHQLEPITISVAWDDRQIEKHLPVVAQAVNGVDPDRQYSPDSVKKALWRYLNIRVFDLLWHLDETDPDELRHYLGKPDLPPLPDEDAQIEKCKSDDAVPAASPAAREEV